jgi:bifunctional DNA-binding transcriptional regulator/antitoxin component of YhaV-PrlF toxin-antitoxin module
MVRLQFDSKQYKVTLPKAIIEAKGWQKGNHLRILLNERGELVLVKYE